MMSETPVASWKQHLALGITGHRPDNPTFKANEASIYAVLDQVFDTIGELCREAGGTVGGSAGEGDATTSVRLHSLLAQGIDQIAAQSALDRGWDLVAPLPFGSKLNLAINAGAGTTQDVEALCTGGRANDTDVEREAEIIGDFYARANVFAIADHDEEIRQLLERTLDDPADGKARAQLHALVADNVALAGRVMIERSDLLIAVWDRAHASFEGGTGHTIATALANGIPVLLIDISAKNAWSVLTLPEELGHSASDSTPEKNLKQLKALIETAVTPTEAGLAAIEREKWRPKSFFGSGVYRFTETVFGGRTTKSGTLQSVYENPEAIAQGSANSLVEAGQKLVGADAAIIASIRDRLLPTFAWYDGVSSRLSDAYRSGMVINFALSAFAIIAGIAYLPLGLTHFKWIFASIELGLLLTILLITFAGYRRGWHRRWFRTRRVAEYLRFGPALAILGVARPVGRWPKGEVSGWPERFSRDLLRDAGLPQAEVDRAYLRTVLSEIALPYIRQQREYHEAKSRQLMRAHHRIDRSADACFLAAFVSVSIYLGIEAGAALGWLPAGLPYAVAKPFTFLGVALPTLGANLAGIRYFGDFERFSSISNVTAGKLANVEKRIELLLSGDEEHLTYRKSSDVVQLVDSIVIEEIASWQSVFSAKHLALPA